MADQYNEGGGLHLKGDYSQPVTGYDESTFGTAGSGSTYSDPGSSTYDTSYQSSDFSYDEPYNTTYTSPSHSDGFVVMDDHVAGVMTGAFMYMFIALLVTGITALVTASSQMLVNAIFGNSISLIVLFVSEFAIVWGASAAMKNNNVVLSAVLFFTYAIVNGLTFSIIFLVYTASSIEQAFFSTAVVFGIMAFVGKVTKKDLSSIGSILLVGLLATIIVSVINMFIGSSALDVGISVVTIFIFLGLTAYDTQKIERMATENSGFNPAVISLWGAMELYLDFINLFLRIIRLMGRRK